MTRARYGTYFWNPSVLKKIIIHSHNYHGVVRWKAMTTLACVTNNQRSSVNVNFRFVQCHSHVSLWCQCHSLHVTYEFSATLVGSSRLLIFSLSFFSQYLLCPILYKQNTMLPRASQFVNMLKNLERNIFHMFGYPPRGKNSMAIISYNVN